MKRITLLAVLAATLALSACTASPALPLSATDGASASASTSDGAPEAAVDFTDPTRPQFGGAIGGP